MIRGSVVVHRRRCGKPTCRCAGGQALHESTVLSYSERGRTRFVMLPAGQVAAVRAAVERYRAAQAKLEAQGEAGRAALLAALAAEKRQR
jgi:acyl-CoA reductase-like NAD-dependent aldehyde dehydrogenase